MQSVPFSTNGSAHLELRYPGEGLPQLPAVEVFRKRDQLVGIVEHLSVDGTGADHPLFTALVAVAQQVFEKQCGLCQHEMRAEQFLQSSGLHQIILVRHRVMN